MTDLLLITDVPRIRKIFNRLSDDKGITLRMASSLEKGGEELLARKPSMVFVQTHLSGLSADILLMHLKKQLGRKRSRFILLCAPSQVSGETIKLYHGHLDTALDDKALLDAFRHTVATLTTRKSANVQEAALAVEDIVAGSAATQAPPALTQVAEPVIEPAQEPPPAQDILDIAGPPEAPAEPSLVDQGITYAPRSRVKVYSEFTSSFDSAVESMQEPEPPQEPARQPFTGWDAGHLEIEPEKKFSKRFSFLLWLAPILVAAVVVTVIQNRKVEQKPVAITVTPQKQEKPPLQQALPAQPPTVSPKQAVSPAPLAAAASQGTAKDAKMQPGDKAILSNEDRSRNDTPGPGHAGARPSALPDFIPTYGKDKEYSAANPGWERYKGRVTEFKVFREKGFIKAIQVIDHGGQGVPETFMKGVLHRMTKKPAFILESSDKKDGYEIQRGSIADNLKVVFYRDEHDGRLRAFVLTWQ